MGRLRVAAANRARAQKTELQLVCANTTASDPCPRLGTPFTATGQKRKDALRYGHGYCSRACSEVGRRANLPAAWQSQSKQRTANGHPPTSMFRGVFWRVRNQKWEAKVTVGRVVVFKKLFIREDEAGAAAASARGKYMTRAALPRPATVEAATRVRPW